MAEDARPEISSELLDRTAAITRAREASGAQDITTAADLWTDLLSGGALAQPDMRVAAQTLLLAGRLHRGLRVLTDARWKQKGSLWFVTQLAKLATNSPEIWRAEGDADNWWGVAKAAMRDAADCRFDDCRDKVERAVRLVRAEGGAVLLSGMIFLITTRLIALDQHGLAHALRARHMEPATPEWARVQEDVLLLNLWRRFDDEADDVVRRAQLAPCWADMNCRGAIYRYRWLREGPSASLIADLRQAHAERPANLVFRDLLYATAGEAGLLADVLGPMDDEQHRWRLEEDAARSLPLAQYLASHGFARKMHSHRFRLMFDAMQREATHFLSVLADPAQSVAVVGNSPIEVGKGRGAAIDAHRQVIRFNDYSVAPPFDRDYGVRTDFAVRTIINKDTLKPDSYPQDTVVLLRHVVFRMSRDWDHILDLYEGGMRFGYLPWSCYHAAAMRVRATPSVGLIVATALAERRGALSRDDFFGFSFLDQLEGERRAHYFSAERPSMIHDWEAEAAIFESLFG
ncbi:hypothetical protein GGR44_001069 [Sphingobium fontiphilum]|uniref:Uncharacterized protein n=1 Tax=Sphingobium fontiphilum TaxID=944425 RepID=A0A7W6GNE5_9SPHN|nr:glycosyltransferase family 29 protein [Sphingobium fontiphilum]MBB3981422.1 hypothetical protein [Sphingobium fontiphilum]